jgi:hypothetical protein
VFDEEVFPFSELHSNAGARLRSEINLLHPTLINPGGVHIVDQFANIPTNPNGLIVEENSGTIDAGNTTNMQPCSDAGHEVDMLRSIGTGGYSHADQQEAPCIPTHADQQQLPCNDSHARVSTPCGRSQGEETESTGGEQQPQLSPPPSTPPPVSPRLSPPVTEVAAGTASQEPQMLARPRTRLQNGIRKEKVYTDGTVKYNFLTSTGEPCSVNDALADINWKHAMETEYSALMNNKTWHLVPQKKEGML